MKIWLIVSLVLAVAFLLSVNENRKYKQKIEGLLDWVDKQESWLKEADGQHCCSCGKPYIPLNDPDYWPESNLCRDCLWKLLYEKTFGEDGS